MKTETTDRQTDRWNCGRGKGLIDNKLVFITDTDTYTCWNPVSVTVEVNVSLRSFLYCMTQLDVLNVTAKSKTFTLLWNEDLKYEANVKSTSCHDWLSNNTAPGHIRFHIVELNKIWKSVVKIYLLDVSSNLKAHQDP